MKTHLQFEAACGPKFFHVVSEMIEDPLSFAAHLPAYVYHVSFRRYRRLNVPLSCKIVEKNVVWGSRFVGEGIPKFRTCIFKSHLFPTMWPDMVEFRSASSEIRGRKKKTEKRICGKICPPTTMSSGLIVIEVERIR